jgi:hypothetical protein
MGSQPIPEGVNVFAIGIRRTRYHNVRGSF